MTSYQLRVLASFIRTEAFLKHGNEEAFSNPKTWDLVDELRLVIEKINALSPVQSQRIAGMSSNNAHLEEVCQALRAELLKITRTARALEDESPQLRSLFTMTRSPSFRALAATARNFIRNSTPEIQALFIESEFPQDYLETINEQLRQLEAATGNRSTQRKERAKATSELKTLFERGMVLLRKLDAAFRNKVTDPTRLEAWRNARNVELLRRRPSKQNLQNEVIEASLPPTVPANAEPIPAETPVAAEIPSQPLASSPIEANLPSPTPVQSSGRTGRKKPNGEDSPAPKKQSPRKQAPLSLQEDFFQALSPEGM